MPSLNTYAYCPNCDKVTEATIEEPTPCITPTTPGRWAAGDIVCRTCYAIIATLFQNLDEEPCQHEAGIVGAGARCERCGEEM